MTLSVSNTVGSDFMILQPGSDHRDMDSYGNFSQMNIKPKLDQLYSLKRDDNGSDVRIIERIGTDYRELGTKLLNDEYGNLMESIMEDARGRTQEITESVFKRWIKGKDSTPVSWKQLVDTLRDVGLKELAKDIVDALNTMSCEYSMVHSSCWI